MKIMTIYDISMNINYDMTVYKNQAERRPVFKVTRDFAIDDVRESNIEMNLHTGTHIDAPLHMLEDGATIETLDLSKVMMKCKVLDLTGVPDRITRAELQVRDIQPGDFILFKTRNSSVTEFDPAFVFLEKSGAAYLKAKNITGVGIDALGIERNQPDHETHQILLEAGIIILEGLRLDQVPAGEYLLLALPLKIDSGDAAPARAVLIKNEGK
jgi:arylformamidase